LALALSIHNKQLFFIIKDSEPQNECSFPPHNPKFKASDLQNADLAYQTLKDPTKVHSNETQQAGMTLVKNKWRVTKVG
jgi:hypothetical protein